MPDLRYMSDQTHLDFVGIVLGGSRSHKGMVGFYETHSGGRCRSLFTPTSTHQQQRLPEMVEMTFMHQKIEYWVTYGLAKVGRAVPRVTECHPGYVLLSKYNAKEKGVTCVTPFLWVVPSCYPAILPTSPSSCTQNASRGMLSITKNLSLNLSFTYPRQIQLPMLRNTVPKIKINQTLVSNIIFLSPILKIYDYLLTQAHSHRLFYLH